MANSNLKEEFGYVMKHCLSKILNNNSIDTIMENSQLIDLALDKARADNKNITSIKVDQHKAEINPKKKLNFSKRSGLAKRAIGESVIKKVIEEIPSKYTNLLSNDLENISNTISSTIQELENLTPDFVSQNLNQVLRSLDNPFADITISDLEIIKQNNKSEISCFCNFKIKENAKQPVAIISINPQLGQNPLMKMKFKIQGNIKFPSMKIRDLQNFRISFREFDATLGIGIQEIKALDVGFGNEESVIYTISEVNIKHKFA